jgi:predicted HicB family RNase H-like nuclease/muconolactone delta-isomerase
MTPALQTNTHSPPGAPPRRARGRAPHYAVIFAFRCPAPLRAAFAAKAAAEGRLTTAVLRRELAAYLAARGYAVPALPAARLRRGSDLDPDLAIDDGAPWHVRMPRGLRDALAEAAESDGLSAAVVVVRVMSEYVAAIAPAGLPRTQMETTLTTRVPPPVAAALREYAASAALSVDAVIRLAVADGAAGRLTLMPVAAHDSEQIGAQVSRAEKAKVQAAADAAGVLQSHYTRACVAAYLDARGALPARLYSTSEAAAQLGVPASTLRRWVRLGYFKRAPGARPGLFSADEIEAIHDECSRLPTMRWVAAGVTPSGQVIAPTWRELGAAAADADVAEVAEGVEVAAADVEMVEELEPI